MPPLKQLTPIIVMLVCATAHSEQRVTYVGGGRYSCVGDERECVPIRQRNDENSRRTYERLEQERREREYRSEQSRQARTFERVQNEQRSKW